MTTESPHVSDRYESIRVEGDIVIYDRESETEGEWIQIDRQHAYEISNDEP